MHYIMLPSELVGFTNHTTEIVKTVSNREMYLLKGELASSADDSLCPLCGSSMHIHDRCEASLRHLCFGNRLSCLKFSKLRYLCPRCGHSHMQRVPFQAQGHRISCELLSYTRDLLAYGFTNKEVAYITGLGKNTVKDIDLRRLQEKYTIDGQRLIKPEKQARFLGVDEFKLHDGHKYAVVIIDMETGHILWLAHGKKKATVYSFIEHVGKEWMEGVEAVATDMNSNFQEAFEERCPHVRIVFDFFHITKNFNDKVVSETRKAEMNRLITEGDLEAAKSLRRSKYILTSSRKTLARKDQEAQNGKVLRKGSTLFDREPVVRREGQLARYEQLVSQNKLLFTLDLIKEKLCDAYKLTDESSMETAINDIIDLCCETGNKHLLWFSRLLGNHIKGITAHATYPISTGKVEGINNKIKTLRRHGYGYPDDDYFFLKLFDASRKGYVRNPVAERIPQDL